MAVACSSVGGRLIRLGNTSGVLPLSIGIQFPDAPTQLVDIGVTDGLSLGQSVQAQFQNALDDTIFVTPFGDAVGTIRLSFIANNQICEDGVIITSSGLSLIKTYLDKRLSPRSEQSKRPVIVSVGDDAFYAYLTSMALQTRAEELATVSGYLEFKAWPQ